MEYACEHDLTVPERLSSLHNHIFDGHCFRHMFFDVILVTIFKIGVMMMKYISG